MGCDGATVNKREFEKKAVQADLLVAGAGPAGFAAAVMAARMGMKVVLVTDRPVIGGNHGSEIQVGISGAGHRPWGRYAQETGVLNEFLERMSRQAEESGIWNWNATDWVYRDMVLSEENISLYLNTLIEDVNLDGQDQISEVIGVQMRSETRYVFKAKYYLDCTGDGTLGYLAGADFRRGRESQSQTGEFRAPECADDITMGATLYFYTVRRERPVRFVLPAWAMDLKKKDRSQFPYNGTCFPKRENGTYGPYWWAEIAGEIDGIHDDPQVMNESWKLVMGIWDYIKNSGEFVDVECLDLDRIMPLAGKRESRRLMGPLIMTETMQREQQKFEDAIGYYGYMMDIHPVGGFDNPDWSGSVHVFHDGPGDIPLRILYSRNVNNLFFAGRNVSATHYGLGTLRVAGTCASMGMGAAAAAALCVQLGITPQEVAQDHSRQLQQMLLRHDASILGKILNEKEDHSRSAKVEASSVRRYEVDELGGFWKSLDRHRGVCIPADNQIQEISFYLKTKKATSAIIEVYSCDKPNNYRLQNKIAESKINVDGEGWFRFAVNAEPGSGEKLFFLLRENPELSMKFVNTSLCGAFELQVDSGCEIGFIAEFFKKPDGVNKTCLPCFTVSGCEDMLRAENIIDGHIRPGGLPHIWTSAKMRAAGEWIKYTFPAENEVGIVELVFNTNLNFDKMVADEVPAEMVKEYTVDLLLVNGATLRVADETENFLRFRRHTFEKVRGVVGAVLTVRQTWGHPYAEVHDFRIYSS